jgi:hypothetical protein
VFNELYDGGACGQVSDKRYVTVHIGFEFLSQHQLMKKKPQLIGKLLTFA